MNGYSWVEGNVVNATDPSGKSVSVAHQINSGLCMQQSSNCYSINLSSAERLRCVAGIDQRNRCNDIKNEANSLLQSGLYNGREALSELIRYASRTFDYDSVIDLSDDISCAITGGVGEDTILQASQFGPAPITEYVRLGPGGWSNSYDDGTDNQAFHLWAYVNSAAQGSSGTFLALLGDFVHECYDIADAAGRSLSDSRLAIAGMFMGELMRNGAIPIDLIDEWVDEWLGTRSFEEFVDEYNLEEIVDYLAIRSCPLIDRNR